MRHRGFTLFELLAALTVIAIGLNLSAFAAREVVDYRSLVSFATRLENALHFARHYALVSHSIVSMCPSSDSRSCTGDDYAAGWIVFSENSTSKNFKLDDGEVILSTHSVSHSTPGKLWRVVPRNLSRIRFLPDGNASYSGRLSVCPSAEAILNTNFRRVFVVNSNGSIRRDDEDSCDA